MRIGDYSYNPVTPVISNINSSGCFPGQTATVTGSDFTTTGNTVNFGGTSVSPTEPTNGTTMYFAIPAGLSAGTYQIIVSNLNGTSNSYSYSVRTTGLTCINVIVN